MAEEIDGINFKSPIRERLGNDLHDLLADIQPVNDENASTLRWRGGIMNVRRRWIDWQNAGLVWGLQSSRLRPGNQETCCSGYEFQPKTEHIAMLS